MVSEIATEQWTGIAGLTAERLVEALGIEDDGIEAVAKVFQVHPCFHPRDYVDLRVTVEDGAVRVAFGACPAFDEGDPYSWLAHLDAASRAAGSHPALDAIARGVNPRASAFAIEPRGDEKLAFAVEIDADAEPHPESDDVKLAKVSQGARIVLDRRRPVRP
jgi:hypothetical protein